ncbi:MAG: YdeI/OmpD-associated family protein [Pseudomonadota bacterium]
MAIQTERFEQVHVANADALWSWLADNHGQAESVWLVTYKKSVPEKYLSTDTILDALIAYGWIDGIRRKLDDTRTMQLIGPRPTQAWAQSYKDRAARLIAEGRMTDAGQRSIDASKAAGLWDYWADVDALICPDDLAKSLQANPAAQAYYNAAAPSYRRNLLRWVKLAKTDKTRDTRIARIVTACAAGQRIPQM